MAHLRLSLLIVVAVMSGEIILASSSPANASTLEDARAAFAKQDYALGAAKFQEAVDQGDPEALAIMGTMYDEGIGVPYDREKAFSLNLKAAEQGRVDAQLHLGIAYFQRSTKDPDRESREREIAEGLKWFKMAAIGAAPKAENGDPIAQWILGESYHYGRGGLTDNDGSKAILWLTKAAEQNVVKRTVYFRSDLRGERSSEGPGMVRQGCPGGARRGSVTSRPNVGTIR